MTLTRLTLASTATVKGPTNDPAHRPFTTSSQMTVTGAALLILVRPGWARRASSQSLYAVVDRPSMKAPVSRADMRRADYLSQGRSGWLRLHEKGTSGMMCRRSGSLPRCRTTSGEWNETESGH